jgi:hypothetical protein
MSRKDYELIAAVFSVARYKASRFSTTGTEAMDEAIDLMAEALKSTNPRFDRTIFVDACRRQPDPSRNAAA